ncbi:hypothetical protein F0562_012601 [Nyssa sinensis]|uniref:BLOC-1-related complex subunit 7 n=1 Tax=Nyssa sinensis TaxID=561372 RepID=A0A5J4ZTK2_9ASTE|nr:hypothetical protein F0562_012601 [Nyssa sinensis]
MATPSTPTTASGGGGRGSSSREGTAKAMVVDQISQAVQSTSNLLHLMQQSSPSQAHLMKLPKNLLAKTSTIKNTEQVLEQMPRVISSLDAHMDNGFQSYSKTLKAANSSRYIKLNSFQRNLNWQTNLQRQAKKTNCRSHFVGGLKQ